MKRSKHAKKNSNLKLILIGLLALLIAGAGLFGVGTLAFSSLHGGNEAPAADFSALREKEPGEDRLSSSSGAQYEHLARCPVSWSDAVEDSYFNDALFIGDSLTDGLSAYGTLRNADYFGTVSATVSSVLSDPDLNTALAGGDYGKIYILLGINEMGSTVSSWINRYETLIERVRSVQPDALIYIQTIFPVIAEKTWSEKVFSREKITAANDGLRLLADRAGCYLLDTHSAFADDSDRMPTTMTGDGVHLRPAYYAVWCDYLRTHTIQD